MKVQFKKLHPNAVVPSKREGDAGFDLVAITHETNHSHGYSEYGTGLAIKIPDGHVGLLFPRSSISNVAQTLANSVGVIDSSYVGEIKLRMKPDTSILLAAIAGEEASEAMEDHLVTYNVGDKIGQLIILPYPKVEFEEVTELVQTERGEGGFGSTGK